MASVKTAISIPDDLYAFLTTQAKRTGMSRSALVAEALTKLREHLRSRDLKDSYDRVYADSTRVVETSELARRSSRKTRSTLRDSDGGW